MYAHRLRGNNITELLVVVLFYSFPLSLSGGNRTQTCILKINRQTSPKKSEQHFAHNGNNTADHQDVYYPAPSEAEIPREHTPIVFLHSDLRIPFLSYGY